MKLLMSCNGREKALGVDKEHVRLSFKVQERHKAAYYEFQISSSKENLINGIFDVGCFSETCPGNHSLWIAPELLEPMTRYYWQVMAQTDVGVDLSRPSWFETGPETWVGEWITGWDDPAGVPKGRTYQFEKRFLVTGKIESARLYISGLGYFDATLNRQRIDDSWFIPQVTDYAPRENTGNPLLGVSKNHRVMYYTYDAQPYMKEGENVLEIEVADGYFYNTEKAEYAYDFSFGAPRLFYELHLIVDGKREVIRSDPDTFVRETNQISLLYHGDCRDATRKEQVCRKSKRLAEQMGNMVAPGCPDDKICQVFTPLQETEMDGGILYDFGINHTGGLKLKVEAKEENAKVHICYAEVLEESGRPNYETSIYDERMPDDGRIQGTHQQNTYILKKGENLLEPRFTWKCYRYAWVQITGEAKVQEIQSLFIHMDLKQDGHFTSSEEILNRIHEMFIQTLYCNLHSGLLTDCPHREKRPYMGDGNQVMKSVLYSMDAVDYFYKWLDDITDAQETTGKIPNTVPNFGGGGGYAWGNAICTLTKELYHSTGDRKVVEKGYEIIQHWLEYYEQNQDEDGIIRSNSGTWLLGDWLAPDTIVSNVYYISTACYYIAVETAEYLAGILEDPRMDDWKKRKEEIAEGINRIFFNREQLQYGYGKQGEDVLALALGIVPEPYIEPLKQKVEQHYRSETDYHFDTGIVLTPILLQYLTEQGYEEIACRMMTATTYPSYFNLMEGDTTFSEHWSKRWPDFYLGEIGNSRLVHGGSDMSHCHPMYGSTVAWLYEKVAGLDLSHMYQKQVHITPYCTEYFKRAGADKKTPYGKVSVEWEQKKHGLQLHLQIPENVTGVVRFPSTYKKLRCSELGLEVQADQKGYFKFTIPSGKWLLETDYS